MKYIPNILTCIRIAMVGVFTALFLSERYIPALITYVLAVLTDLLDGYLARRNNWVTDAGKVLDPLADKLMLIAAMICFYIAQWLPLWLVAIVVIKEGIMILGGILLYKKEVVVYADWFGKFATGFFNVGVAATLCKNFWPWIGRWNLVLLIIAMVLTIVALIHYARKNALPLLKKLMHKGGVQGEKKGDER